MCLPWTRRASSSKSSKPSREKPVPSYPPSSLPSSIPLKPTMPPSTNVSTNGAVQKPSKKGSIISKLSSDQPSNAFSDKKAVELFQAYKDEEVTDGEVIGPEGFERFCGDAQLDVTGPKPLILGWLFGATDMARFTKEEWSSGTSKWRTDTLTRIAALVNDAHDALFSPNSQSQASKLKSRSADSYNKTLFTEYVGSSDVAYKKFYLCGFEMAKSNQARNIDMEVATALWSVILSPKYPMVNSLIDFINEKQTYKGVNKDVWAMTQEFFLEVDLNKLDAYDSEEASWPVMLDEFVAYKKEHPLPNGMEMT